MERLKRAVNRFYEWGWHRESIANPRRYTKISVTFGIIGGAGIWISQGEPNIFGYIGLTGMALFALTEFIFAVLPLLVGIPYVFAKVTGEIIWEKLNNRFPKY